MLTGFVITTVSASILSELRSVRGEAFQRLFDRVMRSIMAASTARPPRWGRGAILGATATYKVSMPTLLSWWALLGSNVRHEVALCE
jgi:hypothetical protein